MALSNVGGFLAFIKSLRFPSPSMNTWIVWASKLFSKAVAASNVFPLVSYSRMSVCNDSIREEYEATSSFGHCLLEYSSRYKCVVVRLGSSEFFNVSLSSFQLLMARNLIAARALFVSRIMIPCYNLGFARSFAHMIGNSYCSRKTSRSSWLMPLNVEGNNFSAASKPIVSTALSNVDKGSAICGELWIFPLSVNLLGSNNVWLPPKLGAMVGFNRLSFILLSVKVSVLST